jgi:hypothetical protein
MLKAKLQAQAPNMVRYLAIEFDLQAAVALVKSNLIAPRVYRYRHHSLL